MTREVLKAVVTALEQAGVRAVTQYPTAAVDKRTPTVCVGVRSETLETPSFGQYLGKEVREGLPVELYGVKARLTVSLDLYLPGDRAGECQELFARVCQALTALPSGVKVRKMVRGELAPDRAAEMLRCPCEMECTAYCAGAREEDSGVWLTFELRGVLNNERE